ncbi:MAG: ABC transporter substrate-binding protein [Pseudomonadota bacterium]
MRIFTACAYLFFCVSMPSGTHAHDILTREMTLRFESFSEAPDAPHWNWFRSGADFHRGAIQGLLEPLFFDDGKTGELIDWLAISARSEQDGLVHRVTLRSQARWSDGARFDAEDVRFSVQAVLDDPRLVGPHVAAVRSAVAEVRAVRRDVVEFTLHAPDPLFLHRHFAASDGMSFPIVPQHLWSGVGDISEHLPDVPLGTGPYELETRFPDGAAQGVVRWTRRAWWGTGVVADRPAPHWLEWIPPRDREDRPALVPAGALDTVTPVSAGVATGLTLVAPHVGLHTVSRPAPDGPCGFDAFYAASSLDTAQQEALRTGFFRLLDRARLSRRAGVSGAQASTSFAEVTPRAARFRDLLTTCGATLPPEPDPQAARIAFEAAGCAIGAANGSADAPAQESSCWDIGKDAAVRIEPETCAPHHKVTCKFGESEEAELSVTVTTARTDDDAGRLAAEMVPALIRFGIKVSLAAVEDDAALDALITHGLDGLALRRRPCAGLDQPKATLERFLAPPRPVTGDIADALRAAIAGLRDENGAAATCAARDASGAAPPLTAAVQAYIAAQNVHVATPLIDSAQLHPIGTLYWSGWREGEKRTAYWSQRTHLTIHALTTN